jgi:hypothetical protein
MIVRAITTSIEEKNPEGWGILVPSDPYLNAIGWF